MLAREIAHFTSSRLRLVASSAAIAVGIEVAASRCATAVGSQGGVMDMVDLRHADISSLPCVCIVLDGALTKRAALARQTREAHGDVNALTAAGSSDDD